MFDRFVASTTTKISHRKSVLLVGSIIVHSVLILGLVIAGFFFVEEVLPPPDRLYSPPPPPPLTVTFSKPVANPVNQPPKPGGGNGGVKHTHRPELCQPTKTKTDEQKPETPKEIGNEPVNPNPIPGGKPGNGPGNGPGIGTGPGGPGSGNCPPGQNCSGTGISAPLPQKTISGLTAEALKVSGSDPIYPPIAKSQGIEGAVMAKICTNLSGSVSSVSTLTGPQILKDAVRQAVMQWRFKPYIVDGRQIPICFARRFVFQLN